MGGALVKILVSAGILYLVLSPALFSASLKFISNPVLFFIAIIGLVIIFSSKR